MRPFADTLRELAGGNTYEELTDALHEVVAAVTDTRRKGSLTLKLTITPNGETSVSISDDIKMDIPQLKRGSTIFFFGHDGLRRDDVRQGRLELKDLKLTAPEQLREVSDAS